MSERPSWTGSAADLLRASVERSSDRIPRTAPVGRKIPAPSPATCVAHRRFFGRSVSRLRSVVKAEPEPRAKGLFRKPWGKVGHAGRFREMHTGQGLQQCGVQKGANDARSEAVPVVAVKSHRPAVVDR